MEAEEKKLWELYKETERPELLEKLVLKYINIVHYLVNKLYIYASNTLEKDDLYSAGVIGLLEAIKRFDLEKGLEFSTFCNIRIRGAIIDEIRKIDWVPRSVRQKAKKIDSTIHRLFSRNGYFPSDKEIADEMKMTIDEYYHITDRMGTMFLSSLEKTISAGNGEDEVKLKDIVEDPSIIPYEDQMIRRKLRENLSEAIAKLPERERMVITLYYYEDLNLKEIGAVLNVSESRISQIHSSAIMKLRSILENIKLHEIY